MKTIRYVVKPTAYLTNLHNNSIIFIASLIIKSSKGENVTPIKPGRFKFSSESIMEVRKQMGLTQNQMANQIGIEPNTLWRWENNKSVPDADALAKVHSLAMERGITPNFFRGKGLGRTRLIVMWDFQNIGVSATDVPSADAWIKEEVNSRFPSMPYRQFKAFAHSSQSSASDELMKLGWRVWEDDQDIDEDLIQQSLSDCGQSPNETVYVLISKDSDYAELLRELVDKGVRSFLIAPPGTSKELVNEVGKNRCIVWRGPNYVSSLPYLKII
ncbi:helix-turn-helix domain-containing protein [Chloroflexota bacterium]